ncbi:TonB-dependent receptor [Chitinophaga oryziterrae]
MKNVFHAIEEQTDVLIMYDLAVIDDNEKVSINVKEMMLEEVLNKLFYNKPVKWSKKGNVVRVFIEAPVKEPVNLGDPVVSLITISGKVTDDKGTALPFANIVVKMTKRGVITDESGNFSLAAIPENASLVISYTGFETIELSIKGQKKILAVLKKNISELDATIIQGYGTTTRRLNTGNIGRITAEEIERQPVMNPLLALQGKIAGLDINQKNGFASAPVKIELRGRGTIGDFPSDPLYIVDGVPLTIVDLYGGSSYKNGSVGYLQNGLTGPAGGQSPFFNINPGDIESIEVLKDADATAIYGSRGANGVILITTKKGKAGKTQLDFHIQEGTSSITRFYHMLNTQQYLAMRKEAYKNDNIVPSSENAYDLSWDTTRYTDWQRALYGGTGKTIDLQGSLSGGDANTTFRIGTEYNHTTNILTVSGADQRAALSLNLTHKSLNQRFSVSLISSYSLTQSNMINLPGNITYAPNAPSIYNAAGNLNYDGWGGQNGDARNAFPFAGLKQPYIAKTNFLNSSLSLSYTIMKGLMFSTSFGYNVAQANQQQLNLFTSKDPLNGSTGDAGWGYNSNRNWIIEPKLSYERFINKGKFQILLGASNQQTLTNGLNISSDGYTSDQAMKTLSNATSQSSQENSGQYRYAGIFGRINYNWENKYMLNISGRRDGSSRFGVGKQYGNFGSVGVAWIFTEEDWFKNNVDFISFGKLRMSYGTTGSDAVGDYKYLTRFSPNGIPSYGNVAGVVPIQHSNPDYRWQVNKKMEAAFNGGFFKNRINIEAAYYRDRCGNQLVYYPTPIFTGFTKVIANSLALVENSGWEFSANGNIIQTKKFNWSINFNISLNKNRLLSYPNFELSPYVGQFVIGQPLNIVRLLHNVGVDSKTGEYIFEDKNKDGQISIDYSGNSDDAYIKKISPDFFGGVGMNFSYQNFQLSMFFNFKKQVGINGTAFGNFPGSINSNQPIEVLNRWQNPGDISHVARFTTQPQLSDGQFTSVSDGIYTDASFIRLSNLSLSYNLPFLYVSKLSMQGCSLFLHANNIFVITRYKGIDPETQNFGGLPPARTIVGGIKFNF